jgi:hypothetical protein
MDSGERSVSDAGSAPSIAWVVGNLDALLRGYGPALKGIGRFNLELLALISRRWQAWLGAPRHFGQCKSPWDVAQEQLRFWQVAVSDYAQSAQRLTTTFGAYAVPPEHQGAAQRDYITVQEPAPAAKRSDRKAA